MQIITATRKRGTALAFLLMGLIAVLALVVVFLSRVGRAPDVSSKGNETVETPAASSSSVDTETSLTLETSETPVAAPVVIPPPPPVLATPDTSHMPPEG